LLKESTKSFISTRSARNEVEKIKIPKTLLPIDVQSVISIDSRALNYASFYPSKLLGSTLSIANRTDYDLIVEISIEGGVQDFSWRELKSTYDAQDIAF
jgi:hypothetical protein